MVMKCLECETEPHFKANHLKEAANLIKSEDMTMYVKYAMEAIDLYSMAGRSSAAASLAKDCAEKLEEEFDLEQSLKFYFKAAELYEIDNQGLQSNSMTNKFCDLTILTWIEPDKINFATVIHSYEKIGFKYLTQVIKSSAKDFFFKAGLCYLANHDLVGAKKAFEKYSFEDPSWD